MKLTRSEPGLMQGGPEPVARTGEVMSGRRGVEAGVDTAEQHGKARRDHVRQGLRVCGGQLGRGGIWHVRAVYGHQSAARAMSRSRARTMCGSANAPVRTAR